MKGTQEVFTSYQKGLSAYNTHPCAPVAYAMLHIIGRQLPCGIELQGPYNEGYELRGGFCNILPAL